jgi:endonuclease/exonuclease/phosphatase family metal-dependent hydrolase
VRLVTFNVLHGLSVRDGLVDGGRYADAVAALNADVLGLQEVDLGQPRSGGLDLTRLAAEALGAAEHRFAAALIGTPGEGFRAAPVPRAWPAEGWVLGDPAAATGPADGAEGPGRGGSGEGGSAGGDEVGLDEAPAGGPFFGVALVSRLPVRSWHVTPLPAAPVRSPVLVPDARGRPRVRLLRDEPRVLLAAVVETAGGPVTVATTHLSFVPGWNAAQLRRVVRELRRLPGPRVLLGDLNMPAAPAAALSGLRPLARCATFPTAFPRVQLDHVLSDAGARLRVRTASTPRSAVSDHRPLVVEVSWAAGGNAAGE